ncbi:MAG: hypothetical protein ACI9ZF_000499 [Bradyrhizobium sp.]|jgi:hypothetical protein
MDLFKMKKSNFVMQAAVASAMLFSASAFAVVDIDAVTPVPLIYASELVATVAVPVTLTNAGNILDLTVLTGYSLAAGEVRYIRVSLDNGSIFSGVSTAVATTPANCALGAVNGQGTNALYFSVTGAGTGCTATDIITVAGAVAISTTATATTVSYSMFDQPSQAQAGGATGRIVNKASKPYLTFASSYALVGAAGTNVVADVGATVPFSQFIVAAPTTAVAAALGTLTYRLATVVPLKASGVAITLADLMATGATGTKLVVTGDFSAVAGANAAANLTNVFLATNGTCTSVQPATALTSTTATFNVGATTTTGSTQLCYTVNGTTAVPAQVYSAVLNPVSATPATYAVTSITGAAAGSITHNGTELQTPLFQNTTGYVSRFVLTNTSAVAAPYTVLTYGETGNTITAGAAITGTVPANGMLVVPADTVAASFSGAPRGFAVFNVAAPSNAIQGVFQIVNSATGAVSNTIMVRSGVN